MTELSVYLLAGALGSFAKDVVQDNRIVLPKYENGCLLLGFIGGMVIGAFVGAVIDHSFLSALLGGYVGTSAISHLLPPVPPDKPY